jgi:hypothetical protein
MCPTKNPLGSGFAHLIVAGVVGARDGLVFGGGGFSIRRIQITAMESAAKIKEGVTFLVTGFRVLFADVNNALRIFLRAVKGESQGLQNDG